MTTGVGAGRYTLFAEIASGEMCVLVGPSGCGKTTTLKMINRLIEPTAGAILIDDVDVATLDVVQLRRGIGYVMQRSIGTFDLPTMFAALVILALLGVILFWIVDRIERLVIPWHVSQREDIIFAS